MGRRTEYDPGTFSWVDLATSDPSAAKAFYAAVFGWAAEDQPAGEVGTYTILRKDGDDVAALYRMRDDQRAAGVPPSWLCYITVTSVDETAERALRLGGVGLAEPFDVLQSGRMAVIRDPTGATLALWEPRAHIGAARVNDPGCLCWNDLVTPVPETAEHFYEELLGWRTAEVEAGGGYRVIYNRGRSNGGMLPAALVGEGVPPHWLPYFNAGRLDDATSNVEASGGHIVAGPRQVPAGRFAVAQDPQGASFALFEGDADD